MLARLGGTPMSRLCREALLAEAVTTPSADVPLDALVLLRMAVDHHGSSGADHSAVDEAIALAGCSGSDRHDPRASPTLAKLPPKTASIRTGTAP